MKWATVYPTVEILKQEISRKESKVLTNLNEKKMKKKILSAMFAVAIMAIAGFNVYMNQTKKGMSELALANVEALADPEYDIDGGELEEIEIACGQKGGPCWQECGFCFEGEYTFKVCGFVGDPIFNCNSGC